MRKESLLTLVLFTALCLLAGMAIGILTGDGINSAPQASPTAPRVTLIGVAPHGLSPTAAPNLQPTPIAGQMGLLIVGVEDANALQPKLEGCWVVAFSPRSNQYYVSSFPPEARFQLASLGRKLTLAEIYAQDVQQEVGYRFVRDAIHSVFPGLAVQAEVTLDRGDLTDMAHMLGGLPIGSELFQALASQHWSPASVAMYLEQLPHAVRPEDAAALTVLAASAPALQSSELTWTVVGDVHDTAPVR
jgi:hypothetical protein